jgi:chemotaxis response regulator CheB
MNRSKNTSLADRLSAAAEAKRAQLERAARARSEAETPAAVERRRAREAVRGTGVSPGGGAVLGGVK